MIQGRWKRVIRSYVSEENGNHQHGENNLEGASAIPGIVSTSRVEPNEEEVKDTSNDWRKPMNHPNVVRFEASGAEVLGIEHVDEPHC